MSFRTNRRTKKVFRTEQSLATEPTVTRLGTRLHPTAPIAFNAELRLRDGRKLNVRVQALNRNEAIEQINNKFPLAKIAKVYKARIATARRIAGRVYGTAEKIGRTAERIERFLGGNDSESEDDEESFL